jgi:hypothetical protein
MKYTSQIVTALGIIAMICGFGTLFWYISWDGPVITYGTITQTIDFPTGTENPTIEFNAIAESTSFSVLVEDLTNNKLAEIKNTISGPKQLSRDYENKVNHWVVTEEDNGFSVDFEEQQETTIYRYRHDIQIIIDVEAIISLDLHTNVGSILLQSEIDNIDLTIENLITLGGNIIVDFLGANCTVENNTCETLDGDVKVFFGENTTVSGNLALRSNNGVVSFNCSNGTILGLDGFFLQTNTGDSGVYFENIVINLNFNFTIYLIVGSLNLTWYQDSYTADNLFYINVNSGNVDVLLAFHPDIGTSFVTEVVSGTENIPPDTSGTGGMGDISFFINTYSGNLNVTRV